jgi:cyanophycin synthetase
MNTIPVRTGCSACGTGAVNHNVARFFNILDEVMHKSVGALFTILRIPNESAIADRFYGYLTELLSLVGLVRFSSDRSKVASGRSELIWEEAVRRGIPMEQVVVAGRYMEQYRAKLNGRWFYFVSIPIPPWMAQQDYVWVDDKFALAGRLEKAHIPVPRARLASSWTQALRAFEELQKPVIIKPRFGSRARHTTTNINTQEELQFAYALAKQIARELVVEEHLFGSVCRATVVGGVLVGFFCGNPPQVTGDGVQTISALITEKNIDRPAKIGAITVNDDVTTFIARKGYTLDSILPTGLTLDLSAKTGRFYGGYTREILPSVHPKMRETMERLAKLIDAPVLGFDLISTDPTADPDTIRWGIIECNSLPFIDLHFYAQEGAPNDIAPHIWDLWDRK